MLDCRGDPLVQECRFTRVGSAQRCSPADLGDKLVIIIIVLLLLLSSPTMSRLEVAEPTEPIGCDMSPSTASIPTGDGGLSSSAVDRRRA